LKDGEEKKNIDMLNECVKKRSISFDHAERRETGGLFSLETICGIFFFSKFEFGFYLKKLIYKKKILEVSVKKKFVNKYQWTRNLRHYRVNHSAK